jgi:hypothetical protein
MRVSRYRSGGSVRIARHTDGATPISVDNPTCGEEFGLRFIAISMTLRLQSRAVLGVLTVSTRARRNPPAIGVPPHNWSLERPITMLERDRIGLEANGQLIYVFEYGV